MAYAPVLTDDQIDRIRAFAKPRSVVADEILYNPDDDTPPVYLVLTGRIRIIAIIGGEEQLVTSYVPASFQVNS
jgi:thioredoxin reductase (NADPH)